MSSCSEIKSILASCLTRGIPVSPLPEKRPLNAKISHAPMRVANLSEDEFLQAVKNALRYFPADTHDILGPEFAQELAEYGHIYMYRFRPSEYEMKAYNINMYPGQCFQAKSIMFMIMNNLNHAIAQYPEELVVYGGNGSCFSNWAQYHLIMKYLSCMEEDQCLMVNSGRAVGLFPSFKHSPRMVISNGMVIPNYSKKSDYERYYALDNSMYGQMTAGSYCYIGPQGIINGTTLVIMSAIRQYLSAKNATGTVHENAAGKIYLSSGLGGMSGAQAKAGVICGMITVIAEIDRLALEKRHSQGWVDEMVFSLDELDARVKRAKKEKQVLSIGYLGNIVDIWEHSAEQVNLVKSGQLTWDTAFIPELASDQTSLHAAFTGGYYPVQIDFATAKNMIHGNPAEFKRLVQESLRRHVEAINKCVAAGSVFWDYGNTFLLEAFRAGADIIDTATRAKLEGLHIPISETNVVMKYKSYVELFMGNIFALGFGPFRYIITSDKEEDLQTADNIALAILKEELELADNTHVEPVSSVGLNGEINTDVAQFSTAGLIRDSIFWLEEACRKHNLIVGSKARILYADTRIRSRVAVAFNTAIAAGTISAPVVLSRDHHDVSGTDSFARETSCIYDGSKFTADMAVQNAIGVASRGCTWVALHNGGGTGWGEAINGGIGLVLTGTEQDGEIAQNVMAFDTQNGISRRAWAGSIEARQTIQHAMKQNPKLQVQIPTIISDDRVKQLVQAAKLK